MTRTHRCLAAVLLACAAAGAARAQAPAAGRPTAVKALLVGLTGDENIGPGVAADLQLVEGYVRGLPGFDPDRDLTKLTGTEVTAENIQRAVEALDVSPTDVLFCYYAGHGAYDPNLAGDDPSGGHFFQIPGGDLRRADLRNWLEAKCARLTVLLTDTCNVAGEFEPFREEAGESTSEHDPELELEPVASRAFATLLFDFTGVVDVNGASQDQYGLAGDLGSLSTIGLLKALDEEDEFLSAALPLIGFDPVLLPIGDPHLGWERFLRDASEDIHGVFRLAKEDLLAQPEPDDDDAKEFRQEVQNQDDLRPQAFRLDIRPAATPQRKLDLVPPAPFCPDGGLALNGLLSSTK